MHQEGLENMNAMGIKDHTGEVRHRSRGSLDLGQRLIAEARGSGAPTEKGGNLRKWYKIYKSERSLVAHVGYRGKAGREAAWYAHFVHYGTDRQEAKPFHRNAVISHIDAFRSQTQAAYKRAIDANLRKFTRQAGYSKKSRRK
ncbi:MAG: hypothetical protein MRY63_06400 [Neomegalonema sp.]|nr:hypothetical protein [Neomegalonema sp.]